MAGNIKRRSYIAASTDIFVGINNERNSVIVQGLKSGLEKNLSKDNYYETLYGTGDFDLYKGHITDGSQIIPILTLINKLDYDKASGIFQFGITETEYNKLMYNDPIGQPNYPHLPPGSSNIRFHLEEVGNTTTNISVTTDFRKYKVGLIFENANGELVTLFPSATNTVTVYTSDDHYFASVEYADSQEFYSELAKAIIQFRTPPSYLGEFGFDWWRIGDNGELPYDGILRTGFESRSPNDVDNSRFDNATEAVSAFKREYQRLPTTVTDQLYYVPWLQLFPKKIGKRPAAVSVAKLRVFGSIHPSWEKLVLDLPASFSTPTTVLFDRNTQPLRTTIDEEIEITCNTASANNQRINVLAYEKGPVKTDVRLAGTINVLRNDNKAVLNHRVLLVKVKVNLFYTNDPVYDNIGAFTTDEIDSLRYTFYLSLGYVSILQSPVTIDLSADSRYKSGGLFIDTLFINGNETPNIFLDLENRFANLQPRYKNYSKVFCFDIQAIDGIRNPLEGKADGIGTNGNVMLFHTRRRFTLSHEILHALGLAHAHLESIFYNHLDPNQKFIFPNAQNATTKDDPNATDNVMGYRFKNFTSWKWQWEILQKNIREWSNE